MEGIPWGSLGEQQEASARPAWLVIEGLVKGWTSWLAWPGPPRLG